jgi:hypothetical protein
MERDLRFREVVESGGTGDENTEMPGSLFEGTEACDCQSWEIFRDISSLLACSYWDEWEGDSRKSMPETGELDGLLDLGKPTSDAMLGLGV